MGETFQNGRCSHCGKTTRFEFSRPEALHPGAMLQQNRYLLGNVLGGGGFGITYIGLDTKDGHRVAIKEFFPRGACTRLPNSSLIQPSDTKSFSNSERSFFREAKTLKRLAAHPGIVQFEALFLENNTAYIVMELLEGRTLRQIIMEDGSISFLQACQYLLPASKALCYIHSEKVLHRDISPDNIYICSNGNVKLIDFGASYVNSEEFTQTHPGIKKRGFSPPEQNASEQKQGPWMDVYAMTACLYYCLAGKNPVDVTERLYEDDPLVIAIEHLPHLNGAQRKVLLTGLQTNYTLRYHDGREFYEALRKECGSAPPPLSPKPKPSQEPREKPISHDPKTEISISKSALSSLLQGWAIETILLVGICCWLYEASGIPLAMLMTFVLDSVALSFSREATLPMLPKHLRYTSRKGMPIIPWQAIGIAFFNAVYPLFLVEIICAIKGNSGCLLLLKTLDVALNEQRKETTNPIASPKSPPSPQPAPVASANQEKRMMLACEEGVILGGLLHLDKEVIRLGRDPNQNDFVIANDRRISGLHCCIMRKDAEYWIEDLKSSNGTYVNEQRIYAPQQLHEGDSIRIGYERFAVVKQPSK